jgi:hypothetical protein
MGERDTPWRARAASRTRPRSVMIRVTSASTADVSCAVEWRLSVIRCAMTRRIRESGSVRAPSPAARGTGRGRTFPLDPPAAVPSTASPRATAASTSSLVRRPPFPVPRISNGVEPVLADQAPHERGEAHAGGLRCESHRRDRCGA